MAVRDLVKFFGNRDKYLCPFPMTDFYEKKPHPLSVMSNESTPPSANRITPSRENAYWFAHAAANEESPSNPQNNPKYPENSKEAQLQKEREERIRLFREQQEEERLKRLKELESSFESSRKYREQQEEERRRKIEEARIKENERRQQVEERKRQIWEAEQERKEAILRRNLEREARIEARRNAQRNSMSFAFGSSTPRTFDLDLAALGHAPLGCSLMSSVSVRRSEEKEPGVKRATSSCSLDRKAEDSDFSMTGDGQTPARSRDRAVSAEPEFSHISVAKQIGIEHMKSDETKACLTMFGDSSTFNTDYSFMSSSRWLTGSGALVGDDCMSRSMISLSSSSRGRRRTDLTPVMPRERSVTPHTVPRGNMSMRAVSMTRLDQLAQPRRRYMESSKDYSSTATPTMPGPRTVSPSMSKSMCNLANMPTPRRMARIPATRGGHMSQSMLHLSGSNQNLSQGYSAKPYISPSSPPYKPLANLRPAQSMTHLAGAPRLTRAARLRASALSSARQEGKTASMMNLNKSDSYYPKKLSAKDTSRSPSRPPSSMSGRSEVSMTSSQSSSVSLRPRPPPRKPRPVSIAGTTLDRSSINLNNTWDKPIRSRESSGAPPLGPKPSRPRSTDLEAVVKNPLPLKKPVPPPKTAQILAKAKSHPVPTKDNLRKGVKIPSEVKKELPSDVKKELPNEVQKEIPKEVKKELPKEVKRELPKEVKKELPKEVKKELPKEGKGELPKEVKKELPKEVEKELPKEVSNAPEAAPLVLLADDKIESPAIQEFSSETTESKSPESSEKITTQLPNQVVNPYPTAENKSERELSPNQENAIDPESVQAKPRITSEEEAKAALAEKRRLAREQAEREAELERQKQEELRKQEEERRIQEELEQKRQEEEQIRLAELHRKLEEEKLQKAIEEQQQREREEKARREEEARLRMEKEEQDRKAREEAERQRLELEERLRKEEQERAERKKRVEQIMSRTRNKSNAANNQQSTSPASETTTPTTGMNILNQSTELMKSSTATTNVILNSTVPEVLSGSDTQPKVFGSSVMQPLNLDILMTHSGVKNGFHGDSIEQSFVKNNTISSANCVPNRTTNLDAISPLQTNGYNSHEEMSVTSSPEDRSEKSNSSGGLLLDLQSTHPSPPNVVPRGHPDQLIDIGGSTNSSNDNYLIHPDVVNSNLVPASDPFHTFESNLPKKQETAITDLLS